MLDADFKSCLVDGLVKTRKCFSGMCRRKLSNTKESGKQKMAFPITFMASVMITLHVPIDNILLPNSKVLSFSEPNLGSCLA